jgi:tetratricopeptide (TPR) repeat protein
MIGALLDDPVVVGDDALDPASSPTPTAPGLDPTAADLEEPLEPGLIGPEPPPVETTVKPSKPRIIYVIREPGEVPRRPQSAAALARAEQLVADGEAARRRGELDVAEQRFHQALAEFSASVAALLGLCDVYFDRAQFEQAVGFAERAVVVDPEHPGARLRLGDTCVKLLRYNDARAHYEKAAELGHPQAAARLHKLKAKLGG